MGDQLNQIKRLLHNLSVPDLKQVKAITDAKLNLINFISTDVSFESFIYDIVDGVYKQRTGSNLLPFFTYKKKGKSAKNFSIYSSKIEDWLSSVLSLGKTTGKAGSKTKLLTLMVGIVMDDIEARSLPLKTDIVMNALANAPNLFNKAYPGYVESGLVNKLLIT